MSCKKLLVSAMVLTGIMCTSAAFAANLEAKVEKNKVSQKYPEISKMIEYNNYTQADAALNSLLKQILPMASHISNLILRLILHLQIRMQ